MHAYTLINLSGFVLCRVSIKLLDQYSCIYFKCFPINGRQNKIPQLGFILDKTAKDAH